MYKLTEDPKSIIKLPSTFIQEGNILWLDYLDWLNIPGNDPLPADPEPTAPPVEVDMRRGRLALLQTGLLDDVEAAIAAMSGDEGKAAQINWEYATALRRNDSLVAAITGGLGLSETEVDELFALALSLPA